MLPTPASSTIAVAGDMTVNPGIWVRQILARPDVSKGKYANVAPETLTFGEMMKIWSEVTGRSGHYVACSPEEYGNIWGSGGAELASQLVAGEVMGDWATGHDVVGMEELGISAEEAPGIRRTLESIKALL